MSMALFIDALIKKDTHLAKKCLQTCEKGDLLLCLKSAIDRKDAKLAKYLIKKKRVDKSLLNNFTQAKLRKLKIA